MDSKTESQSSRLRDFTIRTFIVALAFYLAVSAVLADVFRALDKLDNLLTTATVQLSRIDAYLFRVTNNGQIDPKSELMDALKRLNGLPANPEVHYQVALAKADRGDVAGAVEEINLALGLISPDKDKYKAKLHEWESRLAESKQ